MRTPAVFSALLFLFLPTLALAADPNANDLSLLWGLPFALILLSIALCPLLIGHIWHHHFGKITAFWTVLFLLPYTIAFGLVASFLTVAHALIE